MWICFYLNINAHFITFFSSFSFIYFLSSLCFSSVFFHQPTCLPTEYGNFIWERKKRKKRKVKRQINEPFFLSPTDTASMCWSRPYLRRTKRYLWRSAWRRCSRPGLSRATPAFGASCHFLDPDLWAVLCPVLASLPSCFPGLPPILLFPSLSGVRSALEWFRVSAVTLSWRPHSFLLWYSSWAGLPCNRTASFCRNSTQRHALHPDLIDSIVSLPKAFLLQEASSVAFFIFLC